MKGWTAMATGVALLASGAAVQPASHSGNWADDKDPITKDHTKSKAICRRLGEPNPPAADRPTPAHTKALKGCSAEVLYYGNGAKPDYVKARLCAFIEADAGDDDDPFGGSSVLMQVYANGLGVPRNPDLATAYACGIDGAPAERDGRVLHMQALKTRPGRMDYCDDITSGMAEGQCQAHASDKAKIGRDAKLKGVVSRLPPAARAPYAAMRKAFDAFLDAHDGEVDQSGTARTAITLQEEDANRDQLLKDLDRLVAGQWPAASPADAKTADAALNASYKKAMTALAGKDNYSTVKPEGAKKAQRAWLAYRDAYLHFAAAAQPSLGGDAVLTRLTKLRTAQLDTLPQ